MTLPGSSSLDLFDGFSLHLVSFEAGFEEGFWHEIPLNLEF